jgi:hypothetical protein
MKSFDKFINSKAGLVLVLIIFVIFAGIVGRLDLNTIAP